jgi:SAM-dependent methyltransferase
MNFFMTTNNRTQIIPACPLCLASDNSTLFHTDRSRDYFRCGICNLVHVPPSQHPTRDDERAEYDKHQNSPGDTGYRTFLSRLFDPLNERLKPESYGLDFGCGPGPTLSVMFEEAGHQVEVYDPLYAPNDKTLAKEYDFITASEVIEHLHEPARELERLWSILRPGGWLGIMTKLALDEEAFSKWHYKNDLTHVCFFSEETMEWLSRKWDANYELIGKDVILFQKP